jgi:hypothetical protein
LSPASSSAREAAIPDGPAPTTIASSPSPRFLLATIAAAACFPCSMALRMSPMPPSSPTT